MRNLIMPATAALLLGSAAFAQTTTPPSAQSVPGAAMSDQQRACNNIANPADRAGCLGNLNPSAIAPSVPGTTGSIGTGGADSGGRALGGSTGAAGSLGGSTTGATGGAMGSGIGGTGASGAASGGASGGGGSGGGR